MASSRKSNKPRSGQALPRHANQRLQKPRGITQFLPLTGKQGARKRAGSQFAHSKPLAFDAIARDSTTILDHGGTSIHRGHDCSHGGSDRPPCTPATLFVNQSQYGFWIVQATPQTTRGDRISEPHAGGCQPQQCSGGRRYLRQDFECLLHREPGTVATFRLLHLVGHRRPTRSTCPPRFIGVPGRTTARATGRGLSTTPLAQHSSADNRRTGSTRRLLPDSR